MKLANWHFDPTGFYRDISMRRIAESCGILLHWLNADDERTAREQFNASYPYGLISLQGGSLDEHGVFFYPEDPPQHPLVKAQLRDETIYIYRNSFVAIVQADGSLFMTRMD